MEGSSIKKRKVEGVFGRGDITNQHIDYLIKRLNQGLARERGDDSDNDATTTPSELVKETDVDKASQRKKIVHRLIRDYNSDYFNGDLSQVSREFKISMVQLHYLLPHMLMPAIATLEGGNVTQYSLISSAGDVEQRIWQVGDKSAKGGTTWNKRNTTYCVDLNQWNCGCADFIRAAFNPDPRDDGDTDEEDQANENNDYNIGFGGSRYIRRLRRDPRPPVCRHILACYLGEYAGPLFTRLVTCARLEGHDRADRQRWSALFS